MDSPHLMGLCFLLLAVAAPCPNIAMPSGHPAERTHDSSSGKIKVSVFYCKDCEINICESGRFERFVKIAETENEVFSDGIIELVTKEKQIIMCFRQGNTSEGISDIICLKMVGVRYLCGILNSTAFSANGRGSISPEENKLCCEAETNIWESNLTLKCHTEMSGAETRKAPAGILGEEIPGNPEFPTSKKDIIIIIISVTYLLFLVVYAAMVSMYYYRWYRIIQGNV
ncbi:uncharacterized protein LOC113985126 [Pipra filicauda]|uniref:Uncharacterized protein LOC113985126 n=1 Tax=Pipra filicauda TaxID=649802 RepID=A0A7R5L616_9PASS|nr:uncharacterized protein LOC113985126 [Pipra filicauda]